jgi:hypothetical protein
MHAAIVLDWPRFDVVAVLVRLSSFVFVRRSPHPASWKLPFRNSHKKPVTANCLNVTVA